MQCLLWWIKPKLHKNIWKILCKSLKINSHILMKTLIISDIGFPHFITNFKSKSTFLISIYHQSNPKPICKFAVHMISKVIIKLAIKTCDNYHSSQWFIVVKNAQTLNQPRSVWKIKTQLLRFAVGFKVPLSQFFFIAIVVKRSLASLCLAFNYTIAEWI